MNTSLLSIVLGLLCLWVPAPLLSPSGIRGRIRGPVTRRRDGFFSLARCKINWLDGVRGALGAWLLQRELLTVPAGQEEMARLCLWAYLGALLIGAVAQTVWYDRSLRILGPVFYLAGVSLVVSGPMAGGFAVALALTCALMFRRLSSNFLFLPLFLAAFAAAFHELGLQAAVNVAVAGLPPFLAFAAGTRIAFVRRPRRAPAHSTAEVPAVVPVPVDRLDVRFPVARPADGSCASAKIFTVASDYGETVSTLSMRTGTEG